MNIIFVTKHRGHSGHITLGRGTVFFFSLLTLLVIPGGLIYGGYWYGTRGAHYSPDELHSVFRSELYQQKKELTELKTLSADNINALASRLGQLQSHVIRLDALGDRLGKVAGIDPSEFDFSTSPGVGGPERGSSVDSTSLPDFMAALQKLTRDLDDREQQLAVLEDMLINRNVDQVVKPSGRPVSKGWLSSYYGVRTDPFTGRPDFHEGIDFAGPEGGDVVAVASGVVTWAGGRFGYGNLVEINHGKGYATRYGHNREVLVKVGDMVKKGDIVAHIGSTGRSTGPHVHYEVLRNGHPVNPIRFVGAEDQALRN